MLTADARARASAWALASRARAWTLAYSGMAMAARIPMMATTIINSMSVKPRWLPSTFRFQNFIMYGLQSSRVDGSSWALTTGPALEPPSVQIVCHRDRASKREARTPRQTQCERGGQLPSPFGCCTSGYYGTRTLVASPELVMLKVPAAVSDE